jgi:hypothetical protein
MKNSARDLHNSFDTDFDEDEKKNQAYSEAPGVILSAIDELPLTKEQSTVLPPIELKLSGNQKLMQNTIKIFPTDSQSLIKTDMLKLGTLISSLNDLFSLTPDGDSTQKISLLNQANHFAATLIGCYPYSINESPIRTLVLNNFLVLTDTNIPINKLHQIFTRLKEIPLRNMNVRDLKAQCQAKGLWKVFYDRFVKWSYRGNKETVGKDEQKVYYNHVCGILGKIKRIFSEDFDGVWAQIKKEGFFLFDRKGQKLMELFVPIKDLPKESFEKFLSEFVYHWTNQDVGPEIHLKYFHDIVQNEHYVYSPLDQNLLTKYFFQLPLELVCDNSADVRYR